MEELKKLVLDKGIYLLKQNLIDYAFEKGYVTKKTITKDEAWFAIENNITDHEVIELAERYCDVISYTARQVEEMLKITPQERKTWAKKELLNVSGWYSFRAYGKYLESPLFHPIHTLNITQEDVNEWRSKKRKQTTKQLQAFDKAKKALKEKNTCKLCGCFVSPQSKEHRIFEFRCMCEHCDRITSEQESHDEALKEFKEILNNKDDYVILDIETDGIYNPHALEVAIIDIDGNMLLNTFVKYNYPIPPDAAAVNGITEDMVKDAPAWSEVFPHVKNMLKNKIMLAYNTDFDKEVLYNTSSLNDMDISDFNLNSWCMMKQYMKFISSERYISLNDAKYQMGIDVSQDHRALGDCLLTLELIKKCAGSEV